MSHHVNPKYFKHLLPELAYKATLEIIPEIKRLSDMAGGLKEAFSLTLDLGKKTLLGEDGGSHLAWVSNNYKRKSDSPTDDLLVHLTKRLKEEDGTFKPIKQFEDLTKAEEPCHAP